MKIIAHRGLGIHYFENTLPSIKKAIDLHIPYVEIDVRMTKDNQIIIFHDDNLKRLANSKLQTKDLNLREIQLFHLFIQKKPSTLQPQTIPSLEDILKLPWHATKIVLELKDEKERNITLTQNTISLLRKYKKENDIILSSFSLHILSLIKSMAPNIKRGYLLHKYSYKEQTAIQQENFFSIHPFYLLLGKKLLQNALKNKSEIYPWTVNSVKTLKKIMKLDIQGIITDNPLKFSNHLRENAILLKNSTSKIQR